MRSSGPLRLSGYCGGRCWRLEWLRDAGRPRAEGQVATVVRVAAARAALPRRRRAPPRGPRRPRGETHGRPGPAGRRATAAAGRRPGAPVRNRAPGAPVRNRAPGAPVRNRAPVVAGRVVMVRRTTARGAPRVLRPPTHHAGSGRPRPKVPAGPRAGRPRPEVPAGAWIGRPRPEVPAGPWIGRLRAMDRAG